MREVVSRDAVAELNQSDISQTQIHGTIAATLSRSCSGLAKRIAARNTARTPEHDPPNTDLGPQGCCLNQKGCFIDPRFCSSNTQGAADRVFHTRQGGMFSEQSRPLFLHSETSLKKILSGDLSNVLREPSFEPEAFLEFVEIFDLHHDSHVALKLLLMWYRSGCFSQQTLEIWRCWRT